MPLKTTNCESRTIIAEVSEKFTANSTKPNNYVTGNMSREFTTPIRLYRRLAMSNAAINVTALAMPENAPRNPASAASLENDAEIARPNGKLTEK